MSIRISGEFQEGRVGMTKSRIGLKKSVDRVEKGDNSIQPIHTQNEENP